MKKENLKPTNLLEFLDLFLEEVETSENDYKCIENLKCGLPNEEETVIYAPLLPPEWKEKLYCLDEFRKSIVQFVQLPCFLTFADLLIPTGPEVEGTKPTQVSSLYYKKNETNFDGKVVFLHAIQIQFKKSKLNIEPPKITLRYASFDLPKVENKKEVVPSYVMDEKKFKFDFEKYKHPNCLFDCIIQAMSFNEFNPDGTYNKFDSIIFHSHSLFFNMAFKWTNFSSKVNDKMSTNEGVAADRFAVFVNPDNSKKNFIDVVCSKNKNVSFEIEVYNYPGMLNYEK